MIKENLIADRLLSIVAYIYKQASGFVVHLTFWLVLV